MKKDFLYKAAEKIFERLIAKDKNGKLYSEQVKENLEKLYPFSGEDKTKIHYIRKIRLSLLVCLSGFLLAAGLFISEIVHPVIKENKIDRESYEGTGQEIPVKVTVDHKKRHDLVLKVKERVYGSEQLRELYEKAVPELEKIICGENKSLEHVETDLTLVTELTGYPFQIVWETQNYGIIDSEGNLQDMEISEEGIPTGLKAVFTYEDFRAEHLFYIHIYPKTLTEEEAEKRKLLELIGQADKNSRETEMLILPEELEGKELTWSSYGSKNWLGALFLAICLAGLIYFLKDEDLKKKVKKREGQMRLEYPELVSKLSIYLGAGMTVKMAWEKISEDHEKRRPDHKSYLYEEMKITCQEMKSGISEIAAYERFGKRCGISLYGKFSALLTQNLRKGSTRLGPLLKEESRLAFEERKNSARKAGEEAGTKLLFPMMMMLCVVMLMILLPAFMTF